MDCGIDIEAVIHQIEDARQVERENWLPLTWRRALQGNGNPLVIALVVTGSYRHVFDFLVETLSNFRTGWKSGFLKAKLQKTDLEQGYILATFTWMGPPAILEIYVQDTGSSASSLVLRCSRDFFTFIVKEDIIGILMTKLERQFGAQRVSF